MRMNLLVLAFALLIAPSCAVSNLVFSAHNNTETYTPLMAAASGCQLDEIQKEVRQNHDQINVKDTDMAGATALDFAVSHDCVDVTKYLLENGAHVNTRKKDGLTPLHLAARNGDLPIIKLLLAHHAHINAVASDGKTPVDVALKRNHPEAAEFLESAGGHRGGKSP
jgi:ankyrin repeat protein